MTAILISMAIVAAEPQVHPLAKDKTGINWVLPFSNALKTAESEKRLLMIKPVAFENAGWRLVKFR